MRQSSVRLFVLFVLLSLVRGALYIAIIPPWQAPDEPKHFEYVKLLSEKRRLVDWGDATPSVEQEIIASMDKYSFWVHGVVHSEVFPSDRLPRSFREVWIPRLTHELHQPPIAYVLYAAVLRYASDDVAAQLYAMRLLSLVYGTLVVLGACLTIAEAFPDDDFLLIGVPSFILWLPMHTFTNSVVTNDNLAALLVSCIIVGLVICFRRGFSGLRILAIFVLLVLAVFTKRTGIVAIPIVLSALAIRLWSRRFAAAKPRITKVAVASGATVAVVTLAVSVLYRFRETILQVVPGLEKALHSFVYVYVLYMVRPNTSHEYSIEVAKYFAPGVEAYYRTLLQMLFETFWARFGWVNVRLDSLWYLLPLVFTLAAVIGLGLFGVRLLSGTRSLSRYQKETVFLFGIAIFSAFNLHLVKMIREWDTVPRPLTQGKFLFPVIIPIAALFMLGLRELALKHRRAVLVASIGGLIVLDGLSLLLYVVPFYYY